MALGLVGRTLANFCAEFLANTHPVFYPFIPYWTVVLGALVLSPFTIILPQLLTGKLRWPSRKDVPDVWTIHGKKYNLNPFYASHPGGSFVLRGAKGSDCTGLFESYHLFIDREALLKMMERFEIKEEAKVECKPPMAFADAFYDDLKLEVREHFRGQGKGAHKMCWPYVLFNLAVWVLMWYSIYCMLTQGPLWTIPAIGVCSWFLSGSIMHDASHSALVRSPWLNRLLAHAAFPYGVNVTAWHIQHVMSHHIYTNEESDVDLYHFDPVLTLKKGENGVNIFLHFVRLFYILSSAVAHLAIVVPYGLLFGQVDPAHGHRMYDRVKSIMAHRAELRWEMAAELASVLAFYGVCYSYLGFAKALCYQMMIYVVASYLFCFFTQLSHLQQECFPSAQEKDSLSFAKRQVASSMDFAPDSWFWGNLSGGLNTQALHHIFPSVSATHLRSLYPRFRKVCRKHGVALKEAPSLSAFCWGFIEFAN